METKKTSVTPNLPFYFMKLQTSLEELKVDRDQQGTLKSAQDALQSILFIVYSGDASIHCSGPVTNIVSFK
jgi:hypothetical protein